MSHFQSFHRVAGGNKVGSSGGEGGEGPRGTSLCCRDTCRAACGNVGQAQLVNASTSSRKPIPKMGVGSAWPGPQARLWPATVLSTRVAPFLYAPPPTENHLRREAPSPPQGANFCSARSRQVANQRRRLKRKLDRLAHARLLCPHN